MATRRGKRSGRATTKQATPKAAKRGAKPAPRATAKAAAPPRARHAVPSQHSALDRAEQLAGAVARSKLTARDPWAYTAKARLWQRRAQELMAQIGRSGETAALREKLGALAAEVEGDRDFREARRLF